MEENEEKKTSGILQKMNTYFPFILGAITGCAVILGILFCVQSITLQRQVRDLNEELAYYRKADELRMQEAMNNGHEVIIVDPVEEAADALATEGEQASRVEEASSEEHRVYLTFDDGPSAFTNDILDILAEYNVKATFFVVGKTDEDSLAAYKRIVDEGHTLGMHSYSHKYTSIYASKENFSEDFEKIKYLLTEATGEEPKFYRFPGGSSNTVSKVPMSRYADFLSEQGVVYFDWNISTGDAAGGKLDVADITKNALNGIDKQHDSVILMHDSVDKISTVRALPEIIRQILAMQDTKILPITEETTPIQHLKQK